MNLSRLNRSSRDATLVGSGCHGSSGEVVSALCIKVRFNSSNLFLIPRDRRNRHLVPVRFGHLLEDTYLRELECDYLSIAERPSAIGR